MGAIARSMPPCRQRGGAPMQRGGGGGGGAAGGDDGGSRSLIEVKAELGITRMKR